MKIKNPISKSGKANGHLCCQNGFLAQLWRDEKKLLLSVGIFIVTAFIAIYLDSFWFQAKLPEAFPLDQTIQMTTEAETGNLSGAMKKSMGNAAIAISYAKYGIAQYQVRVPKSGSYQFSAKLSTYQTNGKNSFQVTMIEPGASSNPIKVANISLTPKKWTTLDLPELNEVFANLKEGIDYRLEIYLEPSSGLGLNIDNWTLTKIINENKTSDVDDFRVFNNCGTDYFSNIAVVCANGYRKNNHQSNGSCNSVPAWFQYAKELCLWASQR